MDKYKADFDLIKSDKKNIIFERYVSLPNYNGNFKVRFPNDLQAILFDDIMKSISGYMLNFTIEDLHLILAFVAKITDNNNQGEKNDK